MGNFKRLGVPSEPMDGRAKLTLSMEKTKVTHSSQRVRYLGYDIFVSRSKDTKRSKNGTLRRAWYGTVNLRMPHEKWQSKLQEYKAFIITHDQHGKEQWRAMPRRSLVNREDIDILRKFNSEISGLYQYYRLALNVSTLNKFLYIMEGQHDYRPFRLPPELDAVH